VSNHSFWTDDGRAVPALTAEQMREVDRIAVEDFSLGILQMMENAGRTLAQNVIEMLGGASGEVTILAGAGGNGGGGLCCARHLHNRGFKVWLVLDREAGALRGAASTQLQILRATGLQPAEPAQAEELIGRGQLVVDALIGYSLRGAPRGRAAELIDLCNRHAARVLSLDVPSGLNATTGEAPGSVVQPERTLALALPKTGLQRVAGDLFLADIGIPPEVYCRLGPSFAQAFNLAASGIAQGRPGGLFGERYWIRLRRGGHVGWEQDAGA
jgi:NAD(P)H-hydrate epimerase